MVSLTHVLLLVFAAAMSKLATGDDTFEQQMTMMMENGCLPDDFQPHDFSECKDKTPLAVKMRCIATSSDFSTSSGYDQTAAETFIDARSSDVEWRAHQKKLLAKCASMLMDEVSADEEGVFVQACWIQLMVQDCNRQRFVELAVAVDAENGAKVAEQVAERVEGWCVTTELKNPLASQLEWFMCADEYSLQSNVLLAAGGYYGLLANGSTSLPELTAEYISAVGSEFEKLVDVNDCHALVSGKVSSDGTINYDTILAAIDGADGEQLVKDFAKNIVNVCESKEPASFAEFHACALQSQPFACVGIKSHALVSELFGR